jgi:hypothetical protein
MESAQSEPSTAFIAAEEGREPQRAKPWLQPQRREALLQLHQQVAVEWSEALRDYLRPGDQFAFNGFDFASLGQASEFASDDGCSITFACESSSILGVMILNAELTRYLVEIQLCVDPTVRTMVTQGPAGAMAKTGSEDASPVPLPLTRVENALLQRAIGLLLDKLGTVYSGVGVGALKQMGGGARLESSLGLAPDDYIMVFRYQVGDESSPFKLTVATGTQLANLLPDDPHGGSPVDEAVSLAVSETLLNVKLVLGSWSATIEELAALRKGDEIVLPDGADARLTAGPVVVKRVRVKLCEGRIVIEPKEPPHERK